MIDIELAEWGSCSPDTDERLAGLYLPEDASTHAVIRRCSHILRISELRRGISIHATSFVGRITIANLRIRVKPKLSFEPLLKLFRYAYGIRSLKLFNSLDVNTYQNAFADLLIVQLLGEVDELMSRQLQRKYVEYAEPLMNVRGRIDIQQIAKQGGVVGNTLPCIHYPRSEDHLLNQVLLAGLRLAEVTTDNITLRMDIRRLAAQMVNVSSIDLNYHVLEKVYRQRNRLNRAYDAALTLIGLLLQGNGIVLDNTHESVTLPGFMFDMNLFFQALMSRFLQEHLPDYHVEDQHRLTDMMRYIPEYNPQLRQSPVPRPDFVVFQGIDLISILDAKYSDLWNNTLSRDMLYQLAVYALSRGSGGSAAILYPTLNPTASEERIEIQALNGGSTRAQVALRPVNLNVLEKLLEHSTQSDRIAFARQLAFG